MCSLLTITSRWCSWSMDIHLNDNEDPPPGGLQTRVDDRPGTSSSSCFPVVSKTNSEIWKTRSHRILRQSKGPANFSSHLRRLAARVGNVECASSKLEILGAYQQLLLQLSAVLTRNWGQWVIFHCIDPLASSVCSSKQKKLCLQAQMQ